MKFCTHLGKSGGISKECYRSKWLWRTPIRSVDCPRTHGGQTAHLKIACTIARARVGARGKSMFDPHCSNSHLSASGRWPRFARGLPGGGDVSHGLGKDAEALVRLTGEGQRGWASLLSVPDKPRLLRVPACRLPHSSVGTNISAPCDQHVICFDLIRVAIETITAAACRLCPVPVPGPSQKPSRRQCSAGVNSEPVTPARPPPRPLPRAPATA